MLLILRELLAAALGEIVRERDRDRDVLSRRLGLHDQSAHTLERVAEALGISRERVRQQQGTCGEPCRRGRHCAHAAPRGRSPRNGAAGARRPCCPARAEGVAKAARQPVEG
ncbi:sigma factor-like helix-turn-helix DNA-binding protein [Streptomyces sp. NPDC058304]|uniref:sigma factor-like helix-turn-helix DNA-binding protein n=1 Tax=Streptomyces sp. NPDC058304 TaxID=3346437 RepID=UPI0036E31E1C